MSQPEPIAVWDTRDLAGRWRQPPYPREHVKWAVANIPRADDTYRVEFYLIDAPCAVLYRYARNENGKVVHDSEAATEPPVMVMLPSLPPRHLLGLPSKPAG